MNTNSHLCLCLCLFTLLLNCLFTLLLQQQTLVRGRQLLLPLMTLPGMGWWMQVVLLMRMSW